MYVSRLPAHQEAGQYYDRLTGEIAALVDAAPGHALVLYTSYAAMSAVKERLRGKTPEGLGGGAKAENTVKDQIAQGIRGGMM